MKLWFRTRSREITIIEPSLEGHRAGQLAALRILFSKHRLCVDHAIRPLHHIFTPNPVLFPTVDELFFPFLIIAPLRALFLRRSVAIWHRPKSSTHTLTVKRWRRVAKYWVAKLMKSVPQIALISVQNPKFQPEISDIVTDWIYQSADWYEPVLGYRNKGTIFEGEIAKHANGRPVLIYLGSILQEKGFGFFTDISLEGRRCCAEIAFVAAGKVKQDSTSDVERFIAGGGLLFDRHLSDVEFVTGIGVSDWIWNCYPPENDQNSGIFGISYRAGAKVVVRRGSYIARAALDLQFPTVQIEVTDPRGALLKILSSQTLLVQKPNRNMIDQMRERTRERLLYYLGLG